MAKVRVGILGATGYTALELIKLLLRHREVQITTVTSRQEGQPHISSIHPQLTGRLDLVLQDLSPETVASQCDCVFSCLPHAASASVITKMLAGSVRAVDFSADYRLRDVATYEEWYGGRHPDPDRVGNVVYGLPELFAEKIPDASWSRIPAVTRARRFSRWHLCSANGLIEPQDIIIDAKSGVSVRAALRS